MDTIEEISRGISRFQRLSAENPRALIAHRKELESLYHIISSLLQFPDQSDCVQENESASPPTSGSPQTPPNPLSQVTRIVNHLERQKVAITEFGARSPAHATVDESNKEDFRVRDGKRVLGRGKRTMNEFFRAGLGACSLAEDFFKWAKDAGYASKLDKMFEGDSRTGGNYQKYVKACPNLIDKDQATSLIGIGVRFKFIERACKRLLQCPSPDAESLSSPCSFVWITFFAWSLFRRSSNEALREVAARLTSSHDWNVLARSKNDWIESCFAQYGTSSLSTHAQVTKISSAANKSTGHPPSSSETTGSNTNEVANNPLTKSGQSTSQPLETNRKRNRPHDNVSYGPQKRRRPYSATRLGEVGTPDRTVNPEASPTDFTEAASSSPASTAFAQARIVDSNLPVARPPVQSSSVETLASVDINIPRCKHDIPGSALCLELDRPSPGPIMPFSDPAGEMLQSSPSSFTEIMASIDVNATDLIHEIPLSVLFPDQNTSSPAPNMPFSEAMQGIFEPSSLYSTEIFASVNINIPCCIHDITWSVLLPERDVLSPTSNILLPAETFPEIDFLY
ncbi:hypothetical protein ASPZODRAFT_137918 [Penicilliopsis zonata CBS 506.65]|uniref:Uncharacterized protein n=1 Tax=Penicilliopsis zonata CBS 506.65 TaxID=1073090 RepID=A0A1L9SUA1_9EURO|nr:hypothetical protein ASPZODRAFT_137918 [Penicilliopsis zonata CBS 506.65]OJJ50780.1 hypothetical protein ASPZODRAFT_137918 [Penicilliopsis zonata CBS 506.65]